MRKPPAAAGMQPDRGHQAPGRPAVPVPPVPPLTGGDWGSPAGHPPRRHAPQGPFGAGTAVPGGTPGQTIQPPPRRPYDAGKPGGSDAKAKKPPRKRKRLITAIIVVFVLLVVAVVATSVWQRSFSGDSFSYRGKARMMGHANLYIEAFNEMQQEILNVESDDTGAGSDTGFGESEGLNLEELEGLSQEELEDALDLDGDTGGGSTTGSGAVATVASPFLETMNEELDAMEGLAEDLVGEPKDAADELVAVASTLLTQARAVVSALDDNDTEAFDKSNKSMQSTVEDYNDAVETWKELPTR